MESSSAHSDVILASGGVTATLTLAEPTIYLYGFSKSEQAERPPALVRGTLRLRVTKMTKLKQISLLFRGISRTEWPEGIPSDKAETNEVKQVFSHEWPLFSAKSRDAATSSGAHAVLPLHGEREGDGQIASVPLVNQQDAVSRGYRIFNPAEYVYHVEVLLPQHVPESLRCSFGNVKWGFELNIERHGTFKPNLSGRREVTVLRALGPSNLEACEPIYISRDWEDLLHYEIIIAGKAFAIGQQFSVGFALTPLSKVKCHRIRVYLTEHTEYFCRNKRIHRVEPSHKFLLCEKKAPEGIKGNLLVTEQQGIMQSTEIELDVPIPESFANRRDVLRPNANSKYIKVYHWVKLVMRLSHPELKKNGEPKCYEVSIDSPVTLVDQRTLRANELPEYNLARPRQGSVIDELRAYKNFIQREQPAPGQRALVYLRQPSIAPPPFDADAMPPALLPPQYDAEESIQSYERRFEAYSAAQSVQPPPGPVSGPSTPVFSQIMWSEDAPARADAAARSPLHDDDPLAPLPDAARLASPARLSDHDASPERDERDELDEPGPLDAHTPETTASPASPVRAVPPATPQKLPLPAHPSQPSSQPASQPSSQGSSFEMARGPAPSLRASTESDRPSSEDDSPSPLSSPRASPAPVSIPRPALNTRLAAAVPGAPSPSPHSPHSPSAARPFAAASHVQRLRRPGKDGAQQLFSERWMDRRASAGSPAQPRFFRQSSIVSVDLARDTAHRPEHVGEVEEVDLDEGLRLQRTHSRVSIVSLSDYQRLSDASSPGHAQAQTPLLGDTEFDMGLEWEHDFEDYGFSENRRSVASSFYAMLAP